MEVRALDVVAFDYRVRAGSMLSTTNRHVPALLEHIFSKPENVAARAVRELSLEAIALRAWVRNLEASHDYRLDRALLDPLRRVVRLAPWKTRGGG